MKRKFRWFLILSIASIAAAEPDATFILRVTAYQHTPDVFADRWLGSLPVDPNVPIGAPAGSLWYLKYDGSLNFMSLPQMVGVVRAHQAPGLDLSGQRDITFADMRQLRELNGLRYLNLTGTQVGDRGLIDLFGLNQMQVLFLNDQITDEGMESLRRFSQLIELGLAGSQITDKGLEALRDLPELQGLDLGDTAITDKGLKTLQKIPLKHLRLGPKISDAGLSMLLAIPTLTQLDLAQTQVSDAGYKSLTALTHLHTLFAGSRFGDSALAAIAGMTSMRRLDLTGSAVTDAGFSQIAKLSGLEELSLAHTKTGDASVAALTSLPRLRYLEWSDSAVSLAGIQKLARMKALQVVSFSYGKKLKLGALKPLGAVSTLHTVIVNGQPLPHEAMQYLQKHAPKTTWEKLLDRWVPELNADEPPTTPLSDDTDVSQLTDKKGVSAIHLAGLPRIHSVEAQLDDVIAAPTTISADNPEYNDKNFLGEFSVGATGKKE